MPHVGSKMKDSHGFFTELLSRPTWFNRDIQLDDTSNSMIVVIV